MDQMGPALGQRIMKDVWAEFEALCAANPNEPKALLPHSVGQAYPAIAFYRAIQKNGLSQNEAYRFVYRAFEKQAGQKAKQMRKMMQIPGLYRLMPAMWRVVTKKNFGEDAGFRFHFYDVGNRRVKFDMTQCPYCQLFAKNGCPELTKVLCHTDDVMDGNMHPLLLWNRKKTMGGGDDLCDFDLIVLSKKDLE